jgi:preprotein translocase subunit YajC
LPNTVPSRDGGINGTAVHVQSITGLLAGLLPRLSFLQQPPAGGPGGGPSFFMQFMVPLALVFGIFYFLVIRPANKKQRALQEMLKALKSGDRVITTGGIHGTIAGLTDDIVQLRVANNVKIDVSRNAIAGFQKEE